MQKQMNGSHRSTKMPNAIPRSATFKPGKKKIPEHVTFRGPSTMGKTR